jgi:hypothetical protein
VYTIEVLTVRKSALQIQAQHIVHSSFQEDLGFYSAGQLEPSKSMFKVWVYIGSAWNLIVISACFATHCFLFLLPPS